MTFTENTNEKETQIKEYEINKNHEKTQEMLEIYKEKYKNLKKRFIINHKLLREMMRKVGVPCTFKYNNNGTHLSQTEMEPDSNEPIDFEAFYQEVKRTITDETLEVKEQKKKDIIQYTSTDTNNILKQKYFKNDGGQDKKFENHENILMHILQELKDIKAEQKQMREISANTSKILENNKNNKTVLLKQKKRFRRILEKYREQIKNIHTQLEEWKCKLDEYHVDRFKAMFKIRTLMNNDVKLKKKKESLKSSVTLSDNNEYIEYELTKQMDKIKNPTNHDQYNFDWQIKMINQIENLKDEVNVWKERFEDNKVSLITMTTEKQKAELKLKAFIQKIAMSHDPPTPEKIKSMPQMKENNKQHIFQEEKDVLSNMGNTSKEITSESEFGNLSKDCSTSHEDRRNQDNTLENKKEMMTKIETAINRIHEEVMELLKPEQENEKSDSIDSLDNFNVDTITLSYRDPIKEGQFIVEKSILNKNKDVKNKTEAKEQNETLKGEIAFFDPYCGMQYTNTVYVNMLKDIENKFRNYSSTDNINPTATDENLKKDSESIIGMEVPLVLEIKEKADKARTKKQDKLSGEGFTSHELCLSPRSTTTKDYSIVEETIINKLSNSELRDDFHTKSTKDRIINKKPVVKETEKQDLLNSTLSFTEKNPEISNEIEKNMEILFNNEPSVNSCNNGFAKSDKAHSMCSPLNKESCIFCDIAEFILLKCHSTEGDNNIREKLNSEIIENKNCGIQKNMKDVLKTNEPLSENFKENNTDVGTEDNTEVVIKDVITQDESKFGAKTKVLPKNLPKEISVGDIWKRYKQIVTLRNVNKNCISTSMAKAIFF